MFVMKKCVLLFEKSEFFSWDDVLVLFYFLKNWLMTTVNKQALASNQTIYKLLCTTY